MAIVSLGGEIEDQYVIPSGSNSTDNFLFGADDWVIDSSSNTDIIYGPAGGTYHSQTNVINPILIEPHDNTLSGDFQMYNNQVLTTAEANLAAGSPPLPYYFTGFGFIFDFQSDIFVTTTGTTGCINPYTITMTLANSTSAETFSIEYEIIITQGNSFGVGAGWQRIASILQNGAPIDTVTLDTGTNSQPDFYENVQIVFDETTWTLQRSDLTVGSPVWSTILTCPTPLIASNLDVADTLVFEYKYTSDPGAGGGTTQYINPKMFYKNYTHLVEVDAAPLVLGWNVSNVVYYTPNVTGTTGKQGTFFSTPKSR
jgi:hypothetical protein